MSSLPAAEPQCTRERSTGPVALLIEGHPRDLGGFSVRRVLPSMKRRLVGPFIFFDQMGPAQLAPGHGVDVRPHPHINLATVTYLFEGAIVHRDSVGSLQTIRPGDVNWMTAGRGIVHSERSAPEDRPGGPRLHGIQCWVALPTAHEEVDPSFRHHPASSLPSLRRGGAELRLIAGAAYGATSPVEVLSPLFYVEAKLEDGAELLLPDEYEERAAYVVDGALACEEERFSPGQMLVFSPGCRALVRAHGPAHVMLLGGAKLDGERHIFWNFVSSSKERIEAAKKAWREGRFPRVPGDDQESIPLPEP